MICKLKNTYGTVLSEGKVQGPSIECVNKSLIESIRGDTYRSLKGSELAIYIYIKKVNTFCLIAKKKRKEASNKNA